MNKLKQLQQIERKLNTITATINYTENGAHRQKKITAANEKKLFRLAFYFEMEYFSFRRIKNIQYHGKTVVWNDALTFAYFFNDALTFAHFFFGEESMSFEEFKSAVSNGRAAV